MATTTNQFSAETFGERVERLLAERGISRKTVARETGISVSALSCYISGKRVPHAESLKKLADVLCTTTDYLVNGTRENTRFEEVKAAVREARRFDADQKVELIRILLQNGSGEEGPR